MRVLLATDQVDLGRALSLFLCEQRIQVVDVVDEPDALLEQAASARPDVVVVDWRLCEAATAEVVAALQESGHRTPVIVLATTKERLRARACGAAACATLGDPPDTLLAALHDVRRETRGGAEAG